MAQRQLKKTSSVDIRYLGDHREVIPVLASWLYDEWSFLYPGKTPKYLEGLLLERVHKRKLPITLVALAEGEPVGTVSLKAADMETRSDLSPWVTSLYVAKKWRRRGIGSNLMRAIEQNAVRMGVHKLFLFTGDSALAAHFYKRLGWKVKEKRIYRSYSVIIMEKNL